MGLGGAYGHGWALPAGEASIATPTRMPVGAGGGGTTGVGARAAGSATARALVEPLLAAAAVLPPPFLPPHLLPRKGFFPPPFPGALALALRPGVGAGAGAGAGSGAGAGAGAASGAGVSITGGGLSSPSKLMYQVSTRSVSPDAEETAYEGEERGRTVEIRHSGANNVYKTKSSGERGRRRVSGYGGEVYGHSVGGGGRSLGRHVVVVVRCKPGSYGDWVTAYKTRASMADHDDSPSTLHLKIKPFLKQT
jgi:hypothetical protein